MPITHLFNQLCGMSKHNSKTRMWLIKAFWIWSYKGTWKGPFETNGIGVGNKIKSLYLKWCTLYMHVVVAIQPTYACKSFQLIQCGQGYEVMTPKNVCISIQTWCIFNMPIINISQINPKLPCWGSAYFRQENVGISFATWLQLGAVIYGVWKRTHVPSRNRMWHKWKFISLQKS